MAHISTMEKLGITAPCFSLPNLNAVVKEQTVSLETFEEYPALLVTTGLHDSQVQYFEPAKWVAKLREMKTDDNVLLLHTNMDAGHGGSSGRFKVHKETAMEYAFILDQIGILN